ncbi:MAG TPA: hypothetical protein VGJ00_05535 [Rhabdochlamydiaceae bacterium]
MRFFPLVIVLCLYVSQTVALDDLPQLRSDEYLANNEWTDHTACFAQLFRIQKIHSFLEFGVGQGTKFYLDHCDEVTSIELLDEAKKDNVHYYEHCLNLYHFYANWNPILYTCGQAINSAVVIAEQQKVDPAQFNADFMNEIHAICDKLFAKRCYDAAFVDCGMVARGSVVNALFDRVDIIATHDYNFHPDVYGWSWIKTPPHYEKILFPEGSGTCFWIKKPERTLLKV